MSSSNECNLFPGRRCHQSNGQLFCDREQCGRLTRVQRHATFIPVHPGVTPTMDWQRFQPALPMSSPLQPATITTWHWSRWHGCGVETFRFSPFFTDVMAIAPAISKVGVEDNGTVLAGELNQSPRRSRVMCRHFSTLQPELLCWNSLLALNQMERFDLVSYVYSGLFTPVPCRIWMVPPWKKISFSFKKKGIFSIRLQKLIAINQRIIEVAESQYIH